MMEALPTLNLKTRCFPNKHEGGSDSLFSRTLCAVLEAFPWRKVAWALGLLIFASAPVQGQSSRYYASWQGGAGQAAGSFGDYVQLAEAGGVPLDLSTVIAVRLEEVTLEEALRRIAEEADLALVYGTEKVAVRKRVSLNTERITARKAFQEVLRGTGLRLMRLASGQLVVVDGTEAEANREDRSEQMQKVKALVPDRLGQAAQQVGIITGTVTDSTSGEPLPGVNVVVEGTQQGASTDGQGQYTLSGVEAGTYTLEASFVGYATQSVEGVEVTDGETTEINFALRQSTLALDEIVAVGYGTQQRSDLTGSISSVQGEDLAGTPYSNVEQAMQGKLAGVNVTPYSGEPGASMQVQIRGTGTFGSAEPLYVIDGVPMQGKDMSTINASNIESIEVLKDASSAAIYGARAANGVVLITTKKGQPGELQVDYEGSVGMQRFSDHIPLLNSVEYAELVNETTEADGLPYEPAFHPADPSQNENLQHYTDWQNEAFRPAPVTDHDLRISGGSEDATYSVSGGYMFREGVMVFNNFKRYSTRVNTAFDLSDNLTIGENLSLSRSENFNGGSGNNLHFSYLLGSSPTMRLYKPENEGGYGGPYAPETGVNNRANIVGRRDMRRNWNDKNRLFGNAYAEYELIPNLQYRLNLGLDVVWGQYEQFIRTYDMDNRQVLNASLSQEKNESYDYILENTLNYVADINNNYHIDLLAGFTQERSTSEYISGNVSQFASNDLRALSAGKGSPSLSGNRTEWALRSFISRANIRLYNKYLLSSTFRRDGSSRFGQETRWGNFPSFALGWIISEEGFMQDVGFVDQLKLRASWGQLGNQDISNYVNQTTVSTEIRYVFGDQTASGAAVTSLGNPRLRWEETTQTDIGLDAEFFDSELSFHADYFVRDTEGILLRVPISAATGVDRGAGAYQNAAGLRNSGFEFEMTWRKAIGNLFYNVSGNFSTINNEVTSLGGESSIISYVADVYPDYGGFTITRPGDPMSSFYGWVADGVFQNQEEINNHATQPGARPGDMRFEDLNGDGTISDADRKIIGSPWPNFTYGVGASAEYRNFDLALSIQGVQGRELYPVQRVFLESMNGEHGQMKTTLDRWQPDDPSEIMPRATRSDPNQNSRPSTRFIEDASYLRLNSLEVGYTLPSEFVGQFGLNNFRVNIRGQNLLTFDGYSLYNPDTRGGAGFSEIGGDPLSVGVDTGAYPIPTTIQVGVQAGF